MIIEKVIRNVPAIESLGQPWKLKFPLHPFYYRPNEILTFISPFKWEDYLVQ